LRKIPALIICVLLILTTLLMACSQTPAPAPTITVTPTGSPTQAPHPIVSVANWCAPATTGAYGQWLAVEAVAKKNHPWLRLLTAETPGFVYNLKAHSEQPELWDNTIIGSNPLTIYFGAKKIAPFTESIVGYRNLFIFNSFVYWFVTLDPNIKTVQDLAGKKLGLGLKGQVGWVTAPEYILKEGLGILDEINVQYLGPAQAAQALIDGTVDVSLGAGYVNPKTMEFSAAPDLIQLTASGKKLYHIPIPADLTNKVGQAGPPLTPKMMKSGVVKDMDQDTSTSSYEGTGFAAKDVFPEDLAYEITKLVMENIDELKGYQDIFKLMSPEGMAEPFTKVTMHSGSVRAFEEAGITIPEK